MSLELAVTLGAVFVFVSILAAWGGSVISSQTSAGRRRLHGTAPVKRPDTVTAAATQPAAAQAPEWVGLLNIFARSKKGMNRLKTRLLRAGYSSPSAPLVYAALETLLPCFAGLAVVMAL